MRFLPKQFARIVLIFLVVAFVITFPVVATVNFSPAKIVPSATLQTTPTPTPTPTSTSTPKRELRVTEHGLKDRDLNQNGITVAEPKIYDDAMLQQMLQTAEARLAALEVINQPSIISRLGSVTGASQDTSSVAVNVQGAPVPGLTTTTKLPTETVTEGSQTTAAGATSTSLQTVSGLATRDETTTRSAFSPPTATAPAPTTTLPSAFSVSASDILNEQMQLTAEINGLRLLLSGSLSDYFIRHRPDHKLDEPELLKLKTTLGFHVSITPDRRYKDAVAIVEVEVGIREIVEKQTVKDAIADPSLCPNGRTDDCIEKIVEQRMALRGLPAVTALIPREKTYNVASITDSTTSIGGGVATQILGFSGSWVRGHKTYYLVQDQDTVALSYRPANSQKVGFRWQFRPVLGQHYIKAGLKQTFVQLAFPSLDDASDGEIGRVAVRTYWRRYDRKTGMLKGIVSGSLKEMYRDVDISRFRQPMMPVKFNAAKNIEDLGGGQMLVRLEGRFLPGTYIRIGATPLTEGPRFKQEYNSIKFTAPVADLATKHVFVVAHDGTEEELLFKVDACQNKAIEIRDPSAAAVDDTTSWLRVRVIPPALGQTEALPKLLFVIGQRVFGDADSPLKVEEFGKSGNADYKLYLSALVPNTVYGANARLVVKPLFAPRGCTSNELPIAASKPAAADKLVPLEFGETAIKYLVIGNNLKTLQVISPRDGTIDDLVPNTPDDKMRLLVLKPEHLKTHKQVLLQKTNKPPFLMTLPEFDPKKPAAPKALGAISVKSDEVIIAGEGLADVDGITFREKPITSFKIVNDQTLRISGLSALGLTSAAGTQRIFIKFKSGRTADVDIRVVDNIVESQP